MPKKKKAKVDPEKCLCQSKKVTEADSPSDIKGIIMVKDSYRQGQTPGWFSFEFRCKKCKRTWRKNFHEGGIFD